MEIIFLNLQSFQDFLRTLRELSVSIINESNWEDGLKSERSELSKNLTAFHGGQCFGTLTCETDHDPVTGEMEDRKHGAEVPAWPDLAHHLPS